MVRRCLLDDGLGGGVQCHRLEGVPFDNAVAARQPNHNCAPFIYIVSHYNCELRLRSANGAGLGKRENICLLSYVNNVQSCKNKTGRKMCAITVKDVKNLHIPIVKNTHTRPLATGPGDMYSRLRQCPEYPPEWTYGHFDNWYMDPCVIGLRCYFRVHTAFILLILGAFGR